MPDSILIEVADDSAVGEVRRIGARLGEQLGLDQEKVARISVVATELASNLMKHAKGGMVIMGRDEQTRELEIVSLDHGPGIEDVGEALRDGNSTTGTSGTGLGAISRQADFFSLYSRTKHGTVVLARFGRSKDEAQVGAISIPVHGERVNGDGWAFSSYNGTRTVMVVDGLGHGEPAHDAATAACTAFE